MAQQAYPALVFASEVDRRNLSRAQAQGRLVRVASGIYSGDIGSTAESLSRRYLWPIVAHEMPGAVIVDRSARDGGLGGDGTLYVVADRSRPLILPGITVTPRRGAPALPGDMSLPYGIYVAGEARSLLENLTPSRRTAAGTRRTLTRTEVEEWIDARLASRGVEGINSLRDQARQLAPSLEREREFAALDELIGAALSTRDASQLTSPALRSRAQGQPYDHDRLDAFARMATSLAAAAPDVLPLLPADQSRRTLLPFYEAYFSNYIEGTEFTLDEAAEIVLENAASQQRPLDAHDVLGTYRITSDVDELRRTPQNGNELVELLKARHAVMLGARTDKLPGTFKQQPNQAGSTTFVAPDLVEGTLLHGFDQGASLTSPFARAVFLMFLVSEVHPFIDGNGRIARIMMNAELARANEVRIIIPTVYRLNYLAALKAATHTGNDGALIATLAFARRWTGRIDFSDRRTAEADLARTNALRDAQEAEGAGVRLVLP
jgi:fido (protein-threonine AMPylation protein)